MHVFVLHQTQAAAVGGPITGANINSEGVAYAHRLTLELGRKLAICAFAHKTLLQGLE